MHLHGVQCHPQIALVCGIMGVFHQLLVDRNTLKLSKCLLVKHPFVLLSEAQMLS